MKLETFFNKFELFADAPDAVATMRELVLQLAVTGKLVAQDKRDESASAVLESTKAEREKLVATRKIISREIAPVEPEEQPYELPSSWAWARLSEVGHELGQKVPENRFTYIDVGSIDADRGLISDRVERLEPNDAPSRARKLVTRGTVIYSTVRPYLRNIAIVDQDLDPEPIASTAFGILCPFAGINSRYLFYWLRSAPFTAYVQAGMKGMAYPAINDEKFYDGFIALPPVAEQKRIVAKVDELMALCDRLEAQQQERETRHTPLARASLARFANAPTPTNLNYLFHPSYTIPPADLRKSILTLAVQGKLVPQDPTDEPAETTFPELRSDARVEDFGDRLPFHWSRHIYSSITTLVTSGSRGWKEYYSPSGALFIRTQNIKTDRLRLDDVAFVALPKSTEGMRTQVRVGDIMITITGANVTKAARVVEEIPEAYVSQHIALTRPRWAEMSPWLHLCLLSPAAGRGVLEGLAYGDKPGLNLTNIRDLVFPIPPLAEQRRIVAKVDELMALVDRLEHHLDASSTTANKLLAAVVADLTAAA
jgi:type I restriction enzyme S subunit